MHSDKGELFLEHCGGRFDCLVGEMISCLWSLASAVNKRRSRRVET
jgi:hypothetical protein